MFLILGSKVATRSGSRVVWSLEADLLSISARRGTSLDGTASQFCDILERMLDGPVVDETHLRGNFEFRIGDAEKSAKDFLKRLRDQLGLAVAPAKRNVEIIVFDFR